MIHGDDLHAAVLAGGKMTPEQIARFICADCMERHLEAMALTFDCIGSGEMSPEDLYMAGLVHGVLAQLHADEFANMPEGGVLMLIDVSPEAALRDMWNDPAQPGRDN